MKYLNCEYEEINYEIIIFYWNLKSILQTTIMSHKYLEDCIEVSVREPSQVGQDKKSLLLDFF